MKCPYCQQQVEVEDNFCRHCGQRLKDNANFPLDEQQKGAADRPGTGGKPLPHVNQEIKLEETGEGQTGKYDSRVVGKRDDMLVILQPFVQEEPVKFTAGQEINILFAPGSAAYKFPGEIKEVQTEPFPALLVTKPEAKDIEKIQRRDYFRLEVERRVWYRPINHLDEPLEEDFTRSKSLEVSGGGMKLIMFDISENDVNQLRLEVKLAIPPLEDKSIKARLVNIYEDIASEEGIVAGIKFTDIHYEVRDELMGWLFEKQRQQREKGLI